MSSFTKTDKDLDNVKDSKDENLDQNEVENVYEIPISNKKKIRFSNEVKLRYFLSDAEKYAFGLNEDDWKNERQIETDFLCCDDKENMLYNEEERVDILIHLAESMCDDPQASSAWFNSSDLIQRVTGDDTPSLPSTSTSLTSSGSIDSLPQSYIQRSGRFIKSCWTGVKSYFSF